MCVCICVCCPKLWMSAFLMRYPHTGSTMEPEQRGVSRGLSTPDRFAAGLNGSNGSRVHKIFVIDAAFKFIFTFLLLLSACRRRLMQITHNTENKCQSLHDCWSDLPFMCQKHSNYPNVKSKLNKLKATLSAGEHRSEMTTSQKALMSWTVRCSDPCMRQQD